MAVQKLIKNYLPEITIFSSITEISKLPKMAWPASIIGVKKRLDHRLDLDSKPGSF